MLPRRLLLPLALLLALAPAGLAQDTPPPGPLVPGVIIDYLPARSRIYLGSPSLAVLPGGELVASHDFFGPGSTHSQSAVFGSRDGGATWQERAQLEGQWWSTLFVHQGALYLLGTSREYGSIVLRRSTDAGAHWTTPADATSGLLRADGQYHCAPTPVLVHSGRLWRAFERRDPPKGWGLTFQAGMLSAPVEADLLQAESWTASNFVPGAKAWLGGGFGGWLEGNAVATREGQMLDVLRVDRAAEEEQAALVEISADGRTARFDPANGFIDFPGGAKKFTIRYDERSRVYWSVANYVPLAARRGKPERTRNTAALLSSEDLRHWRVRRLLLQHPDSLQHAFQYLDWQIAGEDLLVVSRTAGDDPSGGAHNQHDANYLTFHRFPDFRDLPATDIPPEQPLRQIP